MEDNKDLGYLDTNSKAMMELKLQIATLENQLKSATRVAAFLCDALDDRNITFPTFINRWWAKNKPMVVPARIQ